MDSFSDALLSAKTDKIPDEYDWFAPLLGDWDCDYYDEFGGQKRYVKGEWIFRRVLEGAGIQDVFIFPSRMTKEMEPQLTVNTVLPFACSIRLKSAMTSAIHAIIV